MVILTRYRSNALNKQQQANAVASLGDIDPALTSLQTENCFYIESDRVLDAEQLEKLEWLLRTPFRDDISKKSFLSAHSKEDIVEIGPRLNFGTAFSTNAASICSTIGVAGVTRVEQTTRYYIASLSKSASAGVVVASLFDRMTEFRYMEPLTSFDMHVKMDQVFYVDVIGRGKQALQEANAKLGLAFDEQDIDLYTNMFTKMGRNPSSVECFDLAQSNSEHSRHWFFKGILVVDDVEIPHSLFDMVIDTQRHSNDNNVIKFNDNSSAIKGFQTTQLIPESGLMPSAFRILKDIKRHIIFTAETHNFPTGVAPFSGATTGTGGRIRDVQATGQGAHVIAGTAGYCFGNLRIPGYTQPWEDESFVYPGNFAKPLEIAIQASNGASDYGNKFGEPVLCGFARSFGENIGGNISGGGGDSAEVERREWIKPIMFSAGIGSLSSKHVHKDVASVGMNMVKVGGPVYRIGVGGGAASSIEVQGDNAIELDFGAVQRGDAEMEQKMNRVIRACIEADHNPIASIHDQGAGGNGNVLKEICEPVGGVVRTSAFELADPTISTLELWGAEYQESNALLVRQGADSDMLAKIGVREKCNVSFVGEVLDTGKIVLEDDRLDAGTPVDLELELVLGKMPRKVFKLDHVKRGLKPLVLPEGLTLKDALDRVLRLPAVASKRYLTNKVDRSVTGLVAQQQCVGPLHTPVADVGVIALSHTDYVGGATSIGEQPIKGLVDAGAGARMSLGEAMTNLVFASVTCVKDIKASGNWMWAAKLAGEGALLYYACKALCDCMKKLGVAIDGGKDSLSMAARVGSETVKAPGEIVVSLYVGCTDIRQTVTPDLKGGVLIHVPFTDGSCRRMGGTALAQCFRQIGDNSPDLSDEALFVQAFETTQKLIKDNKLTAGHDISDGGIITTLLEMAFSGNCGFNMNICDDETAINSLFCEELGIVVEVASSDEAEVVKMYKEAGIQAIVIGATVPEDKVTLTFNGETLLSQTMTSLRDVWEETSFQLEKLQCDPDCVKAEQESLRTRKACPYEVTFDLSTVVADNQILAKSTANKPLLGVIREEGSNGDREMVSAFHQAGFEVWDINVSDLITGRITLQRFKGLAFVGGFSYADVLGSAKGWAATLKFNENVREQFKTFRKSESTFSLGVCNGCQLMALLGWVADDQGEQGVHLSHNVSHRYESRFVSVNIEKSPAMMFKDMQGTKLGVWVAHGEGQFVFKEDRIRQEVDDLVCARYIDDSGKTTMKYPQNPNGSIDGIASLCSRDGRHLAIMPHPERTILNWQNAYLPSSTARTHARYSPWFAMFTNAFEWCSQN